MIGLEKPPGVKNSPAKAPCFPRFSHLYSYSLLVFSPLLLHHVSSPLSLASSFSPSPSFPAYLPLSFGVSYHPALLHLHCGAALTIRTLHTYTRARRHTSTHAYRLTHTHTHTQGDTRPPLPAAPLPLSHFSTADTKHSTTSGVPVFHQETLPALHQNSILHSHTMWLIVYTTKNNCNNKMKNRE